MLVLQPSKNKKSVLVSVCKVDIMYQLLSYFFVHGVAYFTRWSLVGSELQTTSRPKEIIIRK